MLRRVVAVAVVVLLAGCGGSEGGDAKQAGPAIPRRVVCNSIPFPEPRLQGPFGADRADTSSAARLRKIAAAGGGVFGLRGRRWRLLVDNGRVAEYAAGNLPNLTSVVFEKRGRHWTYFRSGGCTPRAWGGPNVEAASWQLTKDEEPDNDAQALDVLVQNNFCNSGRRPTNLVRPAQIVYGEEVITVTYFVEIPRGVQTCPSNPPAEKRLELKEPLGERRLVDGGQLPVRTVFAP